MDPYPKPLRTLIRELKRLPGVGEKSATRLALYILGDKKRLREGLAAALEDIRHIQLCSVCFNLTDNERCPFCANPSRDTSVICVVEEPGDILSLETSGEFHGTYHVLHGLISPMNGVGPEDVRIKELIVRLNPDIKEVVTALSPSVEGDVTAQYISRQITSSGRDINVTRLASGIPMGGELRYMDQVTIASAIRYRRAL